MNKKPHTRKPAPPAPAKPTSLREIVSIPAVCIPSSRYASDVLRACAAILRHEAKIADQGGYQGFQHALKYLADRCEKEAAQLPPLSYSRPRPQE